MSDPSYVMISVSKDGGETFGHERWYPVVSRENLLCRIILRRLGSGYNWVFRIRYSDNRPFTIVSGHADISVGV